MFTHINEYLNRVGYLFTYFIFISTNDVRLYIYTTVSCVYTYTRMPPRLADHPQDERSHLAITRTDERFDLWRIFIIRTPAFFCPGAGMVILEKISPYRS